MAKDATDKANHRREQKRVVAAHERVLARWDADDVADLSEIVATDPLYRPQDPSKVEERFYDELREEVGEIEMKAVTLKLDKYAAPDIIDYEPEFE